MIWVIGGTKDSFDFFREIPKDRLTNFIITVTSEYSKKILEGINKDIKIHVGKLQREEMDDFIQKWNIDKIIDISHPYAEIITKNAVDLAKKNNLDYIRFQRNLFLDKNLETLKQNNLEYHLCDNLNEIRALLETLSGNILVTLGGNSLEVLSQCINKENLFFRILPDLNILKKAFDLGVSPKNIIAMQGPFSKKLNEGMIEQLNINYLVTKCSGINGGELEKISSCLSSGCIPIFLTPPREEIYGNKFFLIKNIINNL